MTPFYLINCMLSISLWTSVVSEWLLFNAKWAIFQLDEMMMMSVFYKINTLSWIFIVLAHWNNYEKTCCSTPHIILIQTCCSTPHIILIPTAKHVAPLHTLFWFRQQNMLLHLTHYSDSDTSSLCSYSLIPCLSEKLQIPVL